MTQKQISQILNMSQTGYSKYETGENDIPTHILIELSKLYKKKGYRTLFFKEKYVEHIGDKRHVHFSKKGKNTVLKFKIDRMIKKIRYNILKFLGKIK